MYYKNEQTTKTCCFTGKRDIPLEKKIEIYNKIKQEILNAIDNGFTNFISGFANGVDIIAAEAVIDIKKQNKNITLSAYLPYSELTKSKKIKPLLEQCDYIKPVSTLYNAGCFHLRNREMVNNSQMLIAVVVGELTAGTKYTISYAQKKDKTINYITL